MGQREAVLSSPSNSSATRAMSRENVEIVRRVYEDWWAGLERDDPGAVFDSEAVADDAEFTVEGGMLDGRSVWRGREEYVEWFRTWTGEFEDWSLGVERLIDAGEDRVVAFTYQSGTGRESGVPVEFKVGAVWELQEGRVVRLRSYLSHDDALEAAGLSENVETFIRGLDAYNRRDIDALLETLEPDVEFHPALAVLLGGKQTVFRGHQGMRESIQEEDDALAVFQVEVSEIRDLGTRILAIGHAHIRGKGSGPEIESPFCVLTESKGTRGKDTRATRIRTYVDPKEALEAAGLRE